MLKAEQDTRQLDAATSDVVLGMPPQQVWNIRTGELVNTMRGHKGWVTCLIYIPQLKYIISGSVDGTIVVWTENYLEVQVRIIAHASLRTCFYSASPTGDSPRTLCEGCHVESPSPS